MKPIVKFILVAVALAAILGLLIGGIVYAAGRSSTKNNSEPTPAPSHAPAHPLNMTIEKQDEIESVCHNDEMINQNFVGCFIKELKKVSSQRFRMLIHVLQLMLIPKYFFLVAAILNYNPRRNWRFKSK